MHHITRAVIPFITASVVFLYAATTTPVAAVQGSIYFSPSGDTLNPGNTFSVEVRGNVPSNGFLAGGATIGVTWPTNLVQMTGINPAGGALGTGSTSIGAGSLTFTVFNYPSRAVNNERIFTLTFKALAAGNAVLNFSSDTNINNGPTTRQPANITIVNPSCPTGQVGTPPNCTTPAPTPAQNPGPTQSTTPSNPSSAATPQKSTAAVSAPIPTNSTPSTSIASASQDETTLSDASEAHDFVIDHLQTTVMYDAASLSWQLPSGATSTFTYGTATNALDNTAQVTLNEDGTTSTTKLAKLRIGTTYHYAIAAKNASDTPVIKTGSFTTKSYPVLLRIKQNQTPLSGAALTLANYDNRYTTDTKGEATLALNPGNYTVRIKKDNTSEEQQFRIQALQFAAGSTPDTQIIDISLTASVATTQKTSPSLLFMLLLGVLAAATALIIGTVLWRRRQAAQNNFGYESIIERDFTAPPYIPGDQQFVAAPQNSTIETYGTPQQNYAPGATPQDSYYIFNPTAPQPTNQYIDTAAIPMQSQITENMQPDDMWTASSATEPQPASPEIVAPTSAVLGESELPSALPATSVAADTFTPSTVVDSAPIDQTPINISSSSATEETYEYNEDNSMTIHHAR